MMVVIAVLLAIAEFVATQRRRINELGIKDSLALGFAQCLALIPGSSRSGSTIMAGLFSGGMREKAGPVFFFFFIPANAARGLLGIKKAVAQNPSGRLSARALCAFIFR